METTLKASQRMKKTPVGGIPVDWEAVTLSEIIAELQSGVSVNGEDRPASNGESGVLKVSAVATGSFRPGENKAILESERSRVTIYPTANSVIVSRANTSDLVGISAYIDVTYPLLFLPDKLWQVVLRDQCRDSMRWLSYVLSTRDARLQLSNRATGTSGSMKNISKPGFLSLRVPRPRFEEQEEIACVLDAWARAIEKTDKLIEAKRELKKGLMQQLLTGKRRFPRFWGKGVGSSNDWKKVRLMDIAHEVSVRNTGGDNSLVLSCTKHEGLVDSLEYFGRQVFSQDTSNYKVVMRGQYAYATNHIEEGSIGYLDFADRGVVSPMYTVFATSGDVHDPFLFRLLKTERMRRIFESRMCASVNRRGSLRWKEFSRIPICLPPLEEQKAIATCLEEVDREINSIESQLESLRDQKKGLMQKLLTGKVRVKV